MPVVPERVQALFWRVIQVSDPGDRVRLLDRECRGDDEMRQRLEALLRAHEDAGGLLSEPIVGSWVQNRRVLPSADDGGALQSDQGGDGEGGRRDDDE